VRSLNLCYIIRDIAFVYLQELCVLVKNVLACGLRRMDAVPPRPEDGTVPVIALFTIVLSCVTDCDFNMVRCPCNGPVREVSP